MTLRKHSSALPAAVLAAALALAGCGSTSSTNTNTNGNGGTGEPPTPPKTSLQKAKDGAMTASQMAQQQSEEAGSKADEADDALEGIILLQTGYQGGEHVVKARQAADAARTAYDTAQAEAGKATGTDSLRVATLAKTAAQKALETAKTQAAVAVAEANKATEAAGNGMHLMHVEGATYKLGDTTITAGPGNNRSKENLLAETKVIATTATEKLVGVDAGSSFLQSEVPSADGTARLIVVSKYAKPKKVTVFHERLRNNNVGALWVLEDMRTETNPYGILVNTSGNYKIEKESGEFYEVSGLPEKTHSFGSYIFLYDNLATSNLNLVKVENDAKDRNVDEDFGIYSVTLLRAGVRWRGCSEFPCPANEKVYLKRIAGSTDHPTWKYTALSVLEDVTFPVATPYDYMNYGTWVSWKEGKPSDLGIGFVQPLSETSMTPLAEMPSTGAATYKGVASTHIRAAHAQGKGDIAHEYVPAETTANFARNTIQVDLDTLGNLEGSIDGNGFSGSKISGVTHTKLTSGAAFQVEAFRGAFFGPGAEEVGGVFDVTSEGEKAGAFRGAFGGRKAE